VTILNQDICRWLEQWFIAKGKVSAGSGNGLWSQNYFEAGLLSSLEVIEFVTEIENHYGIEFSDADFQDPRLVTISGLSELIEEHCAAASRQSAST